uniref:SbcC/MukB-like Walker B domain-containing protein n=1 Tax=Nocardiopsis chromatogenes TaxID=280239 RepID=UPI000378EDF5
VARSSERRAWDAELAAAERAAAVVPLLRTADQRRTELEKAEMATAERLSLVSGLGGVDASSPADALRAAERTRRDEVARLRHLQGDVERCAELRDEVRVLDARIGKTDRELEYWKGRAAELPGRRAELAAELDEARARTGPREAAEEALELARQRLTAAREAARLAEDLSSASARRITAVDAAQTAQEHLLDIRRLRIEGMAAELAGGLADGEPCPVCGSAEHPAPAEGDAARPAQEDEERAQRAAEAAQRRRTDAEGAEAGLAERLAAAQAAAGGWDTEGAAEQVEARKAALDALDAAAAQAAQAAERLAGVDAELDRARENQGALAADLAELTERRTARRAEAERLAERLEAARGEDAGLKARLSRLEGEAGLLQSAAEALDRRAAAAEERRTAEAEARRAAVEAGFAEEAEVRRADRAEGGRAALRERARAYDEELAAVRAVLADMPTAEAEAPAPDLDALRQGADRAQTAADRAEAAAEHAAAWRDRLARRAERLADLRAELSDRLTASRPARERHRVADGLARLAAGTSPANRESVRLSSYVLAARLRQVVAAANDRLTTMSGGRYELRHTVDKAAGDRSRSGGGLGLRVLDAWTGLERDPATLSGGETFIASLSLALGLGDVASQEAGGTDIGTLFVDEGFGTLDEETLEEVLDVLDRLRDGGRAVGVVSHVADLRTRITTRLRVHKSPSGSHLEQTG